MALSFDSVYYFNQRPDVLAAWQDSDLSLSPYEFAVAHYDAFGWKEGANPNKIFNTDEYLDAWPDLVIAGVNPFNHFNEFGLAEGRAPNASTPGLNDFDWELYLSKNSDLTDAGITTKEAAYDHYINFGFAENRPGTPDDGDVLLKDALEELASAHSDLADFLDEALANEALTILPPGGPNDIRNAIETEHNTAAGGLNHDPITSPTNVVDFANATAAAQAEGIAVARAKFNKDITDLNAEVAKIPGLAAAIRSFNAAKQTEAAAEARMVDAGTEAAASLAAFNVLEGGASFAAEDAGGNAIDLATDSDLVDDIVNVVDGATIVIEKNASGNAFVLHLGVTETTNPGVTELLNALNTSLAATKAHEAADAALTVAKNNLDALDTLVDNSDLGDGLGGVSAEDVADDVAGNSAALATFNAAVARFEAAEDLANELENLDDAITAAEQTFEDMGYELPEIVFATAGDIVNGTTDADIFMYNAESGTINGFDIDDVLYFAGAFQSQLLDAGDNMNGNAGFGNIAGLEIFLQQVGLDTVVYVENNTYDGQQNGAWAGETITLVGVDASSLVFDSGFLRISDAVA